MRNLSTKEGPIPVVLVSPRHILLSGLQQTLGGICDLEAASSVERIPAANCDRIVILEQTIWTAEAVSDAARLFAGVIVWLPSISPEVALTSLQMGATGVLGDRCSERDIVQCVEAVASGGSWVPEELNNSLLTRRICKLTPREAELITLLASGLRNKEIAYSLGITEGTVKVYLSKIFTKVGVSDRFELALFALRSAGVLPSAPDKDGNGLPAQQRLQTIPRSVFPLRSAERFTADQGSVPRYRLSA